MNKLTAALICLTSFAMLCLNTHAAVIMTENFGFTQDIPSSPAAASHYWIDDGVFNFYANGTIAHQTGSWTAAQLGFITRSLRDSGELAADEYVKKISTRFDASMTWGGDNNGGLGNSLEVLDADGNGYIGTVKRSGDLDLYRTDAGTAVQIASLGNVANGKNRTITLSVINDQITLADSIGTSLSVYDGTYDRFTTMGYGGIVLSNEVPHVDNVSVSGTVVVPEPASIATMMLILSGFLFRRRSVK